MKTFLTGKAKQTQPNRSAQRGIAMVEFAVVLPLLALIVVALAEFGKLYFTYTTLAKAVENTARTLSANVRTGGGVVLLTPANISAAQLSIITDISSSFNFTNPLAPSNITIACTYGPASSGPGGDICDTPDGNPGTESAVDVHIRGYTYQPMLGGVLVALAGPNLGTIDLNVSTTVPIF